MTASGRLSKPTESFPNEILFHKREEMGKLQGVGNEYGGGNV